MQITTTGATKLQINPLRNDNQQLKVISYVKKEIDITLIKHKLMWSPHFQHYHSSTTTTATTTTSTTVRKWVESQRFLWRTETALSKLRHGQDIAWWRHQMETFFRVTGHLCGKFTGHPAQRPVTRSFQVFFDLHLNKRLSKQSWGWWSETPSRPLWRHWNGILIILWASQTRQGSHTTRVLVGFL